MPVATRRECAHTPLAPRGRISCHGPRGARELRAAGGPDPLASPTLYVPSLIAVLQATTNVAMKRRPSGSSNKYLDSRTRGPSDSRVCDAVWLWIRLVGRGVREWRSRGS